MIRLLNPRKEEKEISVKRQRKEKGVHSYKYEKWDHLSKNFWYEKDKGGTKGKDEGTNLARQYSVDFILMVATTNDMSTSRSGFSTQAAESHD